MMEFLNFPVLRKLACNTRWLKKKKKGEGIHLLFFLHLLQCIFRCIIFLPFFSFLYLLYHQRYSLESLRNKCARMALRCFFLRPFYHKREDAKLTRRLFHIHIFIKSLSIIKGGDRSATSRP